MDAFGGWLGKSQDSRRRDALAPASKDEQLGAIFRQMRAVVGLNEVALARLIGTDLSVIMDLEAGIGEGLPRWPDLVRIVERYASVAGVDPSPIITRLMQISLPMAPPQHMVAPSASLPIETGPSAIPDLAGRFAPPRPHAVQKLPSRNDATHRPVAIAASPRAVATAVPRTAAMARPVTKHVPSPVAEADDVPGEAQAPRRRWWLSRTSGLAVLLVLLLGFYFAVLELPRAAYTSVAYFPARLQEPVRKVIDLAIQQTSAVRDGLRWIDVGDPRIRKTDRQKSQ